MLFSLFPQDSVAIGFFFVVWLFYDWLIDRSPWSKRNLSKAMNRQREAWHLVMQQRHLRMVDTAILAGLQTGATFFASTSLLAVGAGFALLNNAALIAEVGHSLGLDGIGSHAQVALKALCVMVIYAYAFFKFGWSYRLFNYASILVGTIPEANPEVHMQPDAVATPETRRAIRMNQSAAGHFNRGLRAVFFSIGILAWFAGPLVFMAATALIAGVLIHRQFFSSARAAAFVE